MDECTEEMSYDAVGTTAQAVETARVKCLMVDGHLC